MEMRPAYQAEAVAAVLLLTGSIALGACTTSTANTPTESTAQKLSCSVNDTETNKMAKGGHDTVIVDCTGVSPTTLSYYYHGEYVFIPGMGDCHLELITKPGTTTEDSIATHECHKREII